MIDTILIDTSVLVDFLRSKDKSSTKLYFLSSKHSLAVSIVTHTELYAGKSVWESAKAKAELSTIFSGLQILPITEAISLEAGEIRANYTPDLIDALIAATALHHKLPLATSTIKHFKHIPKLQLIAGE